MERAICPTCERTLPIPEEERPPREPRGQVNLSFPTPADAESFRELLVQARERLTELGLKKRVMAGPVAHAAVYGWLTG